jgi:hypothetical protein
VLIIEFSISMATCILEEMKLLWLIEDDSSSAEELLAFAELDLPLMQSLNAPDENNDSRLNILLQLGAGHILSSVVIRSCTH